MSSIWTLRMLYCSRGCWLQTRIKFILLYFIYTEIFASNFAVWKGVSDFTSTNQRGETSFSHVPNLQASDPSADDANELRSKSCLRFGRLGCCIVVADVDYRPGLSLFYFILYILRFSHQILLCEKAFRILLRPIREAKRVSHTWKNRFVQSQTTV